MRRNLTSSLCECCSLDTVSSSYLNTSLSTPEVCGVSSASGERVKVTGVDVSVVVESSHDALLLEIVSSSSSDELDEETRSGSGW